MRDVGMMGRQGNNHVPGREADGWRSDIDSGKVVFGELENLAYADAYWNVMADSNAWYCKWMGERMDA